MKKPFTFGHAAAYAVSGGVALNVLLAYRGFVSDIDAVRYAPRIAFYVPADGSAGLEDCARTEGMSGTVKKVAYLTVVSDKKYLLGDEWQIGETGCWKVEKAGGNAATIRMTDFLDFGHDFKGGLPLGRKVDLPDVNRDGYVGTMDGLREYRESVRTGRARAGSAPGTPGDAAAGVQDARWREALEYAERMNKTNEANRARTNQLPRMR